MYTGLPSKAGYLKAVWPVFGGCLFEDWPAPGARAGPQIYGVVKPPTFLKAIPGPRGRPDLKHAPTIPARLHSRTQS